LSMRMTVLRITGGVARGGRAARNGWAENAVSGRGARVKIMILAFWGVARARRFSRSGLISLRM